MEQELVVFFFAGDAALTPGEHFLGDYAACNWGRAGQPNFKQIIAHEQVTKFSDLSNADESLLILSSTVYVAIPAAMRHSDSLGLSRS